MFNDHKADLNINNPLTSTMRSTAVVNVIVLTLLQAQYLPFVTVFIR